MRRRKSQQWVESPLTENSVQEGHELKNEVCTSAPPQRSVRDTFQARQSLLEFQSFSESKSEYKGFFTLFWVGLFVYMLGTLYKNMKEAGSPLGLKLAVGITEDLFILFIADVLMVSFTVLAPLIQMGILKGIIPLKFSIFLKHFFQSCLIFGSIIMIIGRNWPWVQSGSFFLHTITTFMKMHSYLSTNYELHLKYLEGKQNNEKNSAALKYPDNVTFLNYIYFLLVPTLVYEPSYPRTEKIRISYLIEKGFFAILSMFLMYITIEHYIHPILENTPNLSIHESIIQLLLPFMVCYLMVFFVVFECICNWFAELTRFADREFYSDWWNSVTFDEFARKWNKPVHQFLLRHVYHESIKTYKLSKNNATIITFLFSSLLHELVLAVVGRKILMFMFIMQMIQIPLIWLGRTKAFKSRPLAGNILFWVGMTIGIPLISMLYCRENYLNQS